MSKIHSSYVFLVSGGYLQYAHILPVRQEVFLTDGNGLKLSLVPSLGTRLPKAGFENEQRGSKIKILFTRAYCEYYCTLQQKLLQIESILMLCPGKIQHPSYITCLYIQYLAGL